MSLLPNFLGSRVQQPYVAENDAQIPKTVAGSIEGDLLWAIWQALGGGGGGAATLTDDFHEFGIADGPVHFDVDENYAYAFTVYNNTDTVIQVTISNDFDSTVNRYVIPASGTLSITRNKVTEPALGNIIEISDYSGVYTAGNILLNFTL